MHAMIIGASGMLGQKLAGALVSASQPLPSPLTELTLVDVAKPPRLAADLPQTLVTADLSLPGQAASLAAARPDLIFHLAAIVSGEAEADFDKGYRVNLDGTRMLFDAIREEGRRAHYCPRLVFASSIAVFGAPFPDMIGDEFLTAPLTSYGTQKAICELLLADYSRRRIFDGIGLRLPTVCVRPGLPNRAASGFFSNIIREPLQGKEAVLPVDPSVRHWFASPRAAIGFLLRAASLDLEQVGPRRNLTMPGVSVTVAEQIAALERVAGSKAVRLIRREPNADIQKIVSGWPSNCEAGRAAELGFEAENSFDQIVKAHIEDELEGVID
jgi:D-erythronate 2-dehydrogenase